MSEVRHAEFRLSLGLRQVEREMRNEELREYSGIGGMREGYTDRHLY